MALNPETWLADHGNYLYRYAMTMTRDSEQAEDAVQECLLAALSHLDSYQGNASERTWLTSILRNKLIDSIRRHSRETSLDDIETVMNTMPDEDDLFDRTHHWAEKPSDWGNPVAMLDNKLFWQALHYCLEHMPKKLAQLFMLREINGEETEIICQELNISPTNVWTMLYRSRMGLRQCLDRKIGA